MTTPLQGERRRIYLEGISETKRVGNNGVFVDSAPFVLINETDQPVTGRVLAARYHGDRNQFEFKEIAVRALKEMTFFPDMEVTAPAQDRCYFRVQFEQIKPNEPGKRFVVGIFIDVAVNDEVLTIHSMLAFVR